MKKHELNHFLKDPSKIDKYKLDELLGIVKRYPYFHSGRILLAKRSIELKHPNARQRLRLAALYVADRNYFKKYLSKKTFHSHINTQRPNAGYSPLSKQQIPTPVRPPSKIDKLIEELNSDINNVIKSRTKFFEIQKKIEEEDAVSSALEKVHHSPSTPFAEEDDTTKDREENPTYLDPPPVLETDDFSEKHEEEKTITENVSNEKEEEPDFQNVDIPEEFPKSDNKKRQDQSEIIDKFIKDSPSIKFKNKNKETETDLTSSSSEWNNDLISEHLAEIYLGQGNKQRAIHIYQELCLKFPEKKPYFADIISNLK